MEGLDDIAIKVAGALSGVVRVPSLHAKVSEFRARVAELLGVSPPAQVKLIVGGKTLQDDSKELQDYNITTTSRVLVTRGAAAGPACTAQEDRVRRLDKLKAVAESIASRDGRGLTDKWELSLENQDGTQLMLKAEDRKALVMGLALHEKGKKTLAQGDHKAALDELLLAEEAFNMADSELLKMVDNVGMLLLDIVWCCYKLQDVARLSVCMDRLTKARQSLQRSHGISFERLRVLHGNFQPEMCIYVRLETLEGIVAYYMQNRQAAQQHLQAAEQRWKQMQVCDGSVAILQEMGYTNKEATRALRFCAGDVSAAVTFMTEQKRKAQLRKQDRKAVRAWNAERSQYGKTSSNQYVDHESLERLCQMGYERCLAAEALRVHDNEQSSALDVLCDPVRRGALQLGMVARQIKEAHEGPQDVDGDLVNQLTAMGYKHPAVRRALKDAHDDWDGALDRLEAMGEEARYAEDLLMLEATNGQLPPCEGSADGGLQSGGRGDGDAGPSCSTAAAGTSTGVKQNGKRRSPFKAAKPSASDDELEDELAHAACPDGDDPMSAYDINVDEEGEAIQMYLSMLASCTQ